jgi:hypothetical protein
VARAAAMESAMETASCLFQTPGISVQRDFFLCPPAMFATDTLWTSTATPRSSGNFTIPHNSKAAVVPAIIERFAAGPVHALTPLPGTHLLRIRFALSRANGELRLNSVKKFAEAQIENWVDSIARTSRTKHYRLYLQSTAVLPKLDVAGSNLVSAPSFLWVTNMASPEYLRTPFVVSLAPKPFKIRAFSAS